LSSSDLDAPLQRGQSGALMSVFSRAGVLLTASVAVLSLFTTLARYFWLADLFVHFLVQYAVIAFVGFVLLAWTRRPVWAAIAFFTAALNMVVAAPASGFATAHALPLQTSGHQSARIASINVLYRNQDHQRVIDFVRREKPDAVVFVEVTESWRKALTILQKEYPHHFISDGGGRNGAGVLLMSRWPMRNVQPILLYTSAEPAVSATLDIGERQLQVLAVHTSWPLGAASTNLRNRQFGLLATQAQARKAPLIMLGDFNVSPLSPWFRALLHESGLRSASQTFGWLPTWPTFLPPAGIQIDHALISPDVAVREFRRGPYVGSDHLPIVVDLVL